MEGWGFPSNSRKAHYFVAGRSLCAKWMFPSRILEKGLDDSSSNCTACKKALKRRREKEAVAQLMEKGRVEY